MYAIETIKKDSKNFKGIEGMNVLTYKDDVDTKYIDGPINSDDYDKYYEWLRIETNEANTSTSDNLEDFKVEFISRPEDLVPLIHDFSEVTKIRDATKKDIKEYNSKFNSFFNLEV